VNVQKPVTQMKDEEYEDYETQYRPAVRRVKRIRMVSKVIDQSVVEFDTVSKDVPTSEWVTSSTMAKVKVPMPDKNMSPTENNNNCGC